MAETSAKQRLIRFLQGILLTITRGEEQALALDPAAANQNAFRAIMLEKATMLKGLEDEAANLLSEYAEESSMLGPQEVEKAEGAAETIHRFSKGANTALKLDSVFYMSALLYPDEHKKGEPNNLERLIAWLEQE